MSSCLEAALEYAERGLRVLPLRPGTKVPGVRRWPEQATNDPDVIRAWWSRQPRSNVGIATGTADKLAGPNLAVLDVDIKHGGEIPAWAPDTLTAQTPSGGFHLYYRVGEHVKVPNSVSRLGPGIDVRAEFGQVAAPPSQITDAGDYRWINEHRVCALDDPTILIPEDLQTPWSGDLKHSQWTFEEIFDAVGQRNDYLTAYAGHLFRAGYDYSEVDEALHVRADLLEFAPARDEIAKIVRSVSRYHR
jgi:hypothetical protein